jgi:ribonuclease G
VSIDLVINYSSQEVKIALLKDKVLTELHNEKGSNDFSVGDIYLGKIRKVIPSLNASFVDVGFEKDAFLHYLDLGPQFKSLNKFAKNTLDGKQLKPDLNEFEIEPDIDKNGKINDVVSSSQNILVQVAKEPISTKGPRLTSEITLAGRFLVLVPFSDKISLSQRLKNVEERNRLKKLLQSIKPKNFGVIVRTVAENIKVEELETDLKELVDRWDNIHKNLLNSKPPKRILGELNKTSAVLRDLLSTSFTSITVNDNIIGEEIREYMRKVAPEQEKIVKVYAGKDGIFEAFGIERQIKTSFGKQVNLKSGAYLIIEHTEAMHVIDVNSGNRKGGDRNQEQNALETNLECAAEIARLLRLRDMGGIIAVDFIDMHDKNNQKMLYEKFKDFLKDDKAKHKILPPSRFGVVEITRQRVREVTAINTNEICPTCQGTGEIKPSIITGDDIENNLRYIATELKPSSFLLKVHPFMAAYLTKGIFSMANKWRWKYKKNFKIKSEQSYSLLEFSFVNGNNEKIIS